MKQFKIELTGIREAVVTNQATKAKVTVKVEPYHRDVKGERQIKFQVRVDKVPGSNMSSGVIQVPMKNGKFLKVFESDLDGRKTSDIDSNVDFSKMFN